MTLGGDHSVTIPAVRAVAERGLEAGLVLIDTHLDTALDVGGEELSNCCPITRAIDAGFSPERTVLIGMSGWMNPRAELEYCRERGITVIWIDEIWEAGVAATLERALAIAGGTEGGIYLTVDVDSLDGSYAPGTSVPTNAGLTARELLELVRGIATVGSRRPRRRRDGAEPGGDEHHRRDRHAGGDGRPGGARRSARAGLTAPADRRAAPAVVGTRAGSRRRGGIDRRPALGPRARSLERSREREQGAVGAEPGGRHHPDRQAGVGPVQRQRGGGLAGGVRDPGERREARVAREHVERVAGRRRGVEVAERRRQLGQRRREQHVVALEESVDRATGLLQALDGGQQLRTR